MFMTQKAPKNGLDPGDRMPGYVDALDVVDEIEQSDELMADWSWRDGQPHDPGYIYTPAEQQQYEEFVAAHPSETMPALRPWMVSAYQGNNPPPRGAHR